MNKPVTRIDLEKIGGDNLIVRREWREGWQNDGSTPADTDEMVQGYIVALLAELEKQGYTVWMLSAVKGRALRGKTVRVDIVTGEQDGLLHYRKWPYGWTAKTPAIEDRVIQETEADEIRKWCRDRSWSVRSWPGGFRAFLGAPMPVRDRAAILSIRSKVQAELDQFHTTGGKCFYDFAFDY